MGLSEAVKEITIPKIILLFVLIFVLYGVLDYYFDLYNKLETEQNLKNLIEIKKNTTNPELIKAVDLKFKEMISNMKSRRESVIFVNYIMLLSVIPLLLLLYYVSNNKNTQNEYALYHLLLNPLIVFAMGWVLYDIYSSYYNLEMREEIRILFAIIGIQFAFSFFVKKTIDLPKTIFLYFKGQILKAKS